MKVNEEKLGCRRCSYRNGLVCNICWRDFYEKYGERTNKPNGKINMRYTEKTENS